MLNRWIGIGRLTKSPELRYTPAGKAVASFTLAIDRPFKNQQGEKETDFINVVVWGANAENCSNYLDKGSLCCVDGRLQIRKYEVEVERQPETRWVTEIVAQTVEFLSRKNDGINPGEMGTEIDFSDDDIPF